MSIDKEIFLQKMALLAGHIGRELEAPVQAEYYRALSADLTTEQFVAAMALAFRSWDAAYRNWPSPDQLIELVTPVAAPALSGAEAFERVLEIAGRHTSNPRFALRRDDIMALGAVPYRAFHAAGGLREMSQPLEAEIPWIRKRFVDAYQAACENADAERVASLALASASDAVAAIVTSTAGTLSTMPGQRQKPPTKQLTARTADAAD